MRTLPLPGQDTGRLLARAAEAGVRDLVWLSRRYLGAPVLFTDPEELARLQLSGAAADGAEVRRLLAALDAAYPGLPRDGHGPLGAAVFLLGYEAAAALHPLAPRHPQDPDLGPDARLLRCRAGVRETSAGLEAFFEGEEPPAGLSRLLALAEADDGAPLLGAAPRIAVRPGERERHVERVERCLEALRAGVLYQANLAHRLDVSPASLGEAARFFARRLAEREPPFAAFLDDVRFGSLVSLSPECFLAWDVASRRATAFPIKGTRPRGRGEAEDHARVAELIGSAKDEAEHVMIVDLLRNDLGKVASPGGVTVSTLMQVLSVPNVHHLESVIDAELRPGVTLAALLEAAAPGGSITGAPKSAALEKIHALESGPRGPYTGVLGAVDGRGRGAASILIRTWIRPDVGRGALHVGGGVVVDSDPVQEWQETLDKAAAFTAPRPHVDTEAPGSP